MKKKPKAAAPTASAAPPVPITRKARTPMAAADTILLKLSPTNFFVLAIGLSFGLAGLGGRRHRRGGRQGSNHRNGAGISAAVETQPAGAGAVEGGAGGREGEAGGHQEGAEHYEENRFSVFHIHIIRIRLPFVKGNLAYAAIGQKAYALRVVQEAVFWGDGSGGWVRVRTAYPARVCPFPSFPCALTPPS